MDLDLMLPGMNGLLLRGRIRSEGRRCPVLKLTAKATIEDRVRGVAGPRQRAPAKEVRYRLIDASGQRSYDRLGESDHAIRR